MSGFSLADVVVHRNSAEPARLGAAAFAKDNQIHLAPGQERHLPHEAWHVVQQAQGRVRPTLQMKNGVPVNDDAGLEREADTMGAKALSAASLIAVDAANRARPRLSGCENPGALQAVWEPANQQTWHWDVPLSGVIWLTDGRDYWFEIVGKEGNAYRPYAGKAKKLTHDKWKALGAQDAPQPAPAVEENDNDKLVRKIGTEVRQTDSMDCDRWAKDFHKGLTKAKIPFTAFKLTIRPGKKKNAQAPGAEIHFSGEKVGWDTHYFTVVKLSNGDVVFDNLNPSGMNRASHFAKLSFFIDSGKDKWDPDLVDIAFNENVIVQEEQNASI